MVARFVAMRILTDESRNIGRRVFAQVSFDNEERIELSHETIFVGEEFHQATNVVRYEPSVLPGVSFGIIILSVYGMERIERHTEFAVRTQTTHKLCFGIEELFVRLTALQEVGIVAFLAQQLGHFGDGSVGNGVFQRLGHGLRSRIFVISHVAVLLQRIHTTLVEHSRLLHGFERCLTVFHISLQHKVAQHNDSRVSYHAIGLISHQMPYGKLALLTINIDESSGNIGQNIAMNERHKRLCGTISVPQ